MVFAEKDLKGVTPKSTVYKEQQRRGLPTVTERRVGGVVTLAEAELSSVRAVLLASPAKPELACVVAASPAPRLVFGVWTPSPTRGIVRALFAGS